jgi:hypothetical protein
MPMTIQVRHAFDVTPTVPRMEFMFAQHRLVARQDERPNPFPMIITVAAAILGSESAPCPHSPFLIVAAEIAAFLILGVSTPAAQSLSRARLPDRISLHTRDYT